MDSSSQSVAQLSLLAPLGISDTPQDGVSGEYPGNMFVGAVTLVFIDYLLDASVQWHRGLAIKAAIAAASEVRGLAMKPIFSLYSAAVISGRAAEAEHPEPAIGRLDTRVTEFLARTLLCERSRPSHQRCSRSFTCFLDAVRIEPRWKSHLRHSHTASGLELYEQFGVQDLRLAAITKQCRKVSHSLRQCADCARILPGLPVST
ncbi:hypothetical protein [Rhizobium sp. BK376]|uniref:hypothetical protein n=1 Tax=Rhizobium sp. BK376 TaxID=2512149 RepID=UPI00104842BA|nr:hypothetical protein [Rhizobium sp. BK376]TCR70999.1 hypothetical protein EV561_13730 [Rhizobium sp. BK376]